MPVLALSILLAWAWLNHCFLKYPLSPVLSLEQGWILKEYVKSSLHFCILSNTAQNCGKFFSGSLPVFLFLITVSNSIK